MFEGIVCEMRRCLLAWAASGVGVREVILGGGGSPFFARLVAAALDRAVLVSPVRSASAVGAALLAGLGVGAWDVSAVTAIGRAALGPPVTARPDEVAGSTALYERYDGASSALRRAARAAPSRVRSSTTSKGIPSGKNSRRRVRTDSPTISVTRQFGSSFSRER
jgi:xylulokinase